MTSRAGYCWRSGGAILLALAGASITGLGQGADTVTHLGRLITSTEHIRVADSHETPLAVLDKTIAVSLDEVPLGPALQTIARAAGLKLSYPEDVVASASPVSLHATSITVEQAMLVALHGTGIEALLLRTGTVVLMKHRDRLARPQGGGTVTGRVLDARTNAPVADASVTITGTSHGATTTLDGTYRITEVAPGVYRILVRRLGYTQATQSVAVGRDSVVTVNLFVTPSAAMLDQVVTTVTGTERLSQLGNMIGVINADSVSRNSPVTTLTDVITARTPGVQVFNAGGLTGQSPVINIRGQNSFTLSNEPLLVVDGVRVENSTASMETNTNVTGNGVQSGRFNDLVPAEIESIEIVKGPSAATLYGTDAANGVVLVTTKRGASGPARWTVYGETGVLTQDTSRYLDSYHGFGHAIPSGVPQQCLLLQVGAGQCVQDSVTRFNPLKYSATSPYAPGYRDQLGAQAAGGGQRTRYFVAGSYEREVGPLRMPAIDVRTVDSLRGGAGSVASDESRPNGIDKYAARDNITIQLGANADASLSVGLVSQTSRIPDNALGASAGYGAGYRDALNGWSSLFGGPASIFVQRHDETAQHLTGGLSGTWAPLRPLRTRATVGVDYSTDLYDVLIRPAEDLSYPSFGVGSRLNQRTNIGLYSVDLGATLNEDVGAHLSTKTSVGVQYNRRLSLLTSAGASNLVVGTTTVSGGSVLSARESTVETVVAGAYAEEMVGLNGRLFLTGAVRADGGSAFGSQFSTSTYPKASVSWLVSQEPFMPHLPGVTSLRLRAAYGASGVQPGSTDALTSLTLNPVEIGGTLATGASLGNFGNARLKPERQAELESGADLDLVGGRVRVEATYYNKSSRDALVTLPLGHSVGGGTQWVNVGSVQNRGVEGLVGITPLDGRLRWDVTLNGSYNWSKVLRVAPGIREFDLYYAYRAGYPVGAYFAAPMTYRDANGDGLIEPNEVTVGATPQYLGAVYPKSQLTAATSLALTPAHVQLGVQVDHRGGYLLRDYSRLLPCFFGSCRDAVDPHAPLRDQAEWVATDVYNGGPAYLEDGSFTRLREVSVTYALPLRLARSFRARTVSVTAAGRNLALWTRYRGADPEVNANPGIPGSYDDIGGVPMTSYWIGRVTVDF